ncbi:hypothetical protein TNCV_3544781 [Trichonephila clavipes]|nr:hypothetical protein TNCV_3544781 [Trichonephila clavipes]
MTLLAKRQWLEEMRKRHCWQKKTAARENDTAGKKTAAREKSKPPIKQKPNINQTNPVRGKRKHLKQITSTGKVSKKAVIDEIILLSKDKPLRKILKLHLKLSKI